MGRAESLAEITKHSPPMHIKHDMMYHHHHPGAHSGPPHPRMGVPHHQMAGAMDTMELLEPLCPPPLGVDNSGPGSGPQLHGPAGLYPHGMNPMIAPHHHLAANHHMTMHDMETDPRELEAFAERFKQRRIKLGVTQADVGKALANLKLPGVGSLSQSTICRFESLTLSHNNMVALKPILQAWLEAAEIQAKNKRRDPEMPNVLPIGEKKRKRTSIASPEKRSLEAYFAVQPRPSGEKIAAIAEKLDLKKNVAMMRGPKQVVIRRDEVQAGYKMRGRRFHYKNSLLLFPDGHVMAPSRKKKKNAEKPIVTLAQLEMENEEVKQNFEQKIQNPHPTSRFYLLQSLIEFINLWSEQIKALIAEVENLSGTLASFKELDEIKLQTACQSTQTSPAPSCKGTSTQTDSTKPATPAPTKRKHPEAPYPPAKRTNLKGPTKPAPSRVSKPAAAQVVLHGEKRRPTQWSSLTTHRLTQEQCLKLSALPTFYPKACYHLPGNKLDGMKVRQQKVILPHICLFKVDEETSNSTIEEALLETPAVSQLPGDKVVRVAHRSAPRNGTCTAFIEVDLTTFRALDNRGRIVVDGVILNFEESIRARICFRCCGFGHNSAQCTRAPTCFHCGEGGHEGRACPSVADRYTSKCANCCAKGLPEKHAARASSCPILKLRALKF
ncbi:POU4F2 [Cordylochernes scorpioides]|uniref:POU4F2 n=1 Tax=Cordylochernes scorpioides TaxID=51811 RepID=A0ABY6LUB7_9ARAC|nr:POU4F2 [Cordylochernes scorpioides]